MYSDLSKHMNRRSSFNACLHSILRLLKMNPYWLIILGDFRKECAPPHQLNSISRSKGHGAHIAVQGGVLVEKKKCILLLIKTLSAPVSIVIVSFLSVPTKFLCFLMELACFPATWHCTVSCRAEIAPPTFDQRAWSWSRRQNMFSSASLQRQRFCAPRCSVENGF